MPVPVMCCAAILDTNPINHSAELQASKQAVLLNMIEFESRLWKIHRHTLITESLRFHSRITNVYVKAKLRKRDS